MQVEPQGQTDSRFTAVRDEFISLWQDIEVGAGVSAWVDGEPVVDLTAGWVDRALAVPWQPDTLINIYSTTKGLAALALAIAVDEGLVDYDEKVTTYWPEFGQAGKEDVTVAMLVSHRAGLVGVDDRLTVPDLYDWPAMIHRLETQAPFWPPGTAAGYHAVTWGYFPGEIIRRVTGKTLGAWFQEKVAAPLGADCFIGVPDEALARCAPLMGPNHARVQAKERAEAEVGEFYEAALLNPPITPFRDASSTPWRQAEIAASNGHATAGGLGRIYAALSMGGELAGQRIISNAALDLACTSEVEGETDKVLGSPLRRARGFMLNQDGNWGPSKLAFGHDGAGGSGAFADPENRVALAYVMNQMQSVPTATPRLRRLVDRLYSCL